MYFRQLESHNDCGCQKKKPGMVDVVAGAQWGDEGKGKLVDILSPQYDICARVAGGSNAGHTIVVSVSMMPNYIKPQSNYIVIFMFPYFCFSLIFAFLGEKIQIPFSPLRDP